MNTKNLIKVITYNIDGFEGCDLESISYIISDETPIDDEELNQSDIQEVDTVFDSYNSSVK
jgi:hypothetical protein